METDTRQRYLGPIPIGRERRISPTHREVFSRRGVRVQHVDYLDKDFSTRGRHCTEVSFRRSGLVQVDTYFMDRNGGKIRDAQPTTLNPNVLFSKEGFSMKKRKFGTRVVFRKREV